MKAVMLSIRPEWCEKIAQGRKTMELRKSKPKLELPFKCFIYCTLAGSNELFKKTLSGDVARWNREKWADKKGHVIGEFICDSVLSHCEMANADIAEQMSCVRREKIREYSGGKEVFGWHISELVIYDKPKELSEFYKPCIKEAYPWCLNCERGLTEEERLMHIYNRIVDIPCDGWLKRPPQSWYYVEELSYEP